MLMQKKKSDKLKKTRQQFLNYRQLAISPIRRRLLYYANEAIKIAMPSQFVSSSIRVKGSFLYIKNKKIPLGRRVFIIGFGKAASAMAVALEDALGAENITAGVVVSNEKFSRPKKVKVFSATHPLPTAQSVLGAKQILKLKKQYKIDKDDLIIALISGGGSSLVSLPAEGISLAQKISVMKILIHSGANVHEMTVVKKKLSQIKGGKLAQFFYPTPIVSLIVSDVVDNDTSVIASGPFSPDRSTYKEALAILLKRSPYKKNILKIKDFLNKKRKIKEQRNKFNHVKEFILADNLTALKRVKDLAVESGCAVVVKTKIQGEARLLAKKICSDVFNRRIKKPTLFLFGGETTVTLPQRHGLGGRNQEFITACLAYLENKTIQGGWCILSLATDGVDYHSGSAGGIIDNAILEKVKKKKINLLRVLGQHASYNLLNKVKANLKIGQATGTNVCDVMLFYREPANT